MSEELLLYEVDGAVATITFNRPEAMNSLNTTLRAKLLEAVNLAEENPDVRVVVLTGNGRGFCAGADLSEGLDQPVDRQLLEEYKPSLMAIARSSKIYIASVNGAAAGIGAAYALNCDYVIMADNAYFYLAFAAIGLVPDGGANWHFLRAMGYRKAFETIVEGKKIDAQTCMDLGMVNQSVELEQLHDTVRAKASQLAQGAPLAQAAAKRILRQADQLSMEAVIDLEAREQVNLTASEDCRNAVDAFFNKQKPVFTGR